MIENNVDLPSVVLLIAMRNEEKYISKCLDSIINQEYPKNKLEILVLDGMSTDSSVEIVKEKFLNEPFIKLFHNNKKVQSAAWNLGVRLSSSDIVGIVSAHAELAPDYVRQVVETLTRTQVDMVGGPTNAIGEGFIAETIAIAMNSPFGVGGANFHYTNKECETDTVFMGVCWRKSYERIGGFDEEMIRNQDDEFSYRLRKNGGRIICNPAIKSRYFNRSRIDELWKQYFIYGLYKILVFQKNPCQMRPRQFVPPAFVAALSGSVFLTFYSHWGWILLALVAGSYLLANLAASVFAAAKKGWKHLPLLPVTYAILHLSYGSGFLVGLVKFANRWGIKKRVDTELQAPPSGGK